MQTKMEYVIRAQKADGHLVSFCEQAVGSIKLINESLKNESWFPSSLSSLVSALSVLPVQEKGYYTFLELESLVNHTRNTMVKKFLKLKELGFVAYEDFDKSNSQPGLKSKFIKVVNTAECVSLIKKQRKENPVTDKVTSLRKVHSNLGNSNLDKSARVNVKNLQYAFLPKYLSFIEKVLVAKGVRKKTHVTQIKMGNEIKVIEARSSDYVMAVEDIQILCACITLTINQWSNMSDVLYAKKELPPNQLYAEVFQILKLTGSSTNDSSYERVRGSMKRILLTTFMSVQGGSIFSDLLGDDIVDLVEFSFFQKKKIYTREKDLRLSDDEIHYKAQAYLLEWEQSFYERFLTDEFFFSIPIPMLSAKPYIFIFYLHLRKCFSKDPSLEMFMDIDEIYNVLCIGRGNDVPTIRSFKSTFTTSLKRHIDLEPVADSDCFDDLDSNRSIVNYDIEGFKINAVLYKDTIESIRCTVDQHKMLKSSGVNSDLNGKVQTGSGNRFAAPQVVNPLAQYNWIIRKLSNLGEYLPKKLSLRMVNREVSFTGKRTGAFYVVLDPNDKKREYVFTAYAAEQYMATVSETFSEKALFQSTIFDKIKSSVALLPKLKVGQAADQILEKDTFDDIIDRLFLDSSLIVEPVDLYQVLQSNHGLLSNILAYWELDVHRDRIVSGIAGLIKSNQQQLTFDGLVHKE